MESQVPKRARTDVLLTGGHAQPPRMLEYYRVGKLCDVQLRSEGRVFHAHRNVLAATSDTLDRMFAGAGGFADSTTATFDLPPPYTSEALEVTLEFTYAGKCTVAADCLASLLELAHYLQVEQLVAGVVSAVEERLCKDDVLGWWVIADRLSLATLEKAAGSVALAQFDAVKAHADFAKMPFAFMEQTFGSDELKAATELSVFQAAAAWIASQDPPLAADRVARLLKLVRYPLIPREELHRVKEDPVVTSHPQGVSLLLESFEDARYERPHGKSLARPRFGAIPHGVQLDLPANFLNDWECWIDTRYVDAVEEDNLTSVPETATWVFVGARHPDGHIAMGACGRREAVLMRKAKPVTGGARARAVSVETYEDNGVYWYFYEDMSFGFSRVPQVKLHVADICDSDDEEDGKYRLSWHLDCGGYRAGLITDLDDDGNGRGWRKLVFYK